jgi:hypothetical protein
VQHPGTHGEALDKGVIFDNCPARRSGRDVYLSNACLGTKQMARIQHSRIAPDATAQNLLAGNYGLTLPVRIVFGVGVKKTGDDWAPVVASLLGEYCVQARIFPHQTDITEASIPGLVNQGNFQAVLDALDQLGVPSAAHNYYPMAAVQAHEDMHANRCRLALENKAPEIIASIEALRVPISAGGGRILRLSKR